MIYPMCDILHVGRKKRPLAILANGLAGSGSIFRWCGMRTENSLDACPALWFDSTASRIVITISLIHFFVNLMFLVGCIPDFLRDLSDQCWLQPGQCISATWWTIIWDTPFLVLLPPVLAFLYTHF